MMTSAKIALLLAAAGLAAATHAAPMAADYVAKAGAGDKYEIESSKLVMGSKNAGIKKFADMMVADHNKSTSEVKAAAMKLGMTPKPPMLSAKQAKMIADLKAKSGAARDMEYVNQQKMAHQEALALQKDYSKNGDKPSLKVAAAGIVPVVEHHIKMLDDMKM